MFLLIVMWSGLSLAYWSTKCEIIPHFDFNSYFHDYWWYSESTQNLCQTLALPGILIYSMLSLLLRLIMVDLHHFIAIILKLTCLCSWQWFLCTFLCLLVAMNQGVLKTGHTIEASRENWCGEVVTAVNTHDPEACRAILWEDFRGVLRRQLVRTLSTVDRT